MDIPIELQKEMEKLNIEVGVKGEVEQKMCALVCQPSMFEEILKSQESNPKLGKI